MENEFVQIAALIGEPKRAIVVWKLLDGKALTSIELANIAETSPQNMSMHLAKLVAAGLLTVENQGRHKYYRFSREEVAFAIEAMSNLIPHSSTKPTKQVIMSPIKYCRTCYDHLAGMIGVSILDSLLEQGIIMENKTILEVSKSGEEWLLGLGINVNKLKEQRRSFLRPCLDWSERRNHIAGSLATSLLNTMINLDWIRKTKNSRAVIITGKGQIELYNHFKLSSI